MGNQTEGQAEGQADNGSRQTVYEDKGDGALAGNLTRDPELRYTPDGKAVVSLRVAETVRQRNADTGDWEDGETTFYDVIAWSGLAEHVAESLSKGDRVAAVGRWQRQSWTDQQGEPRAKTVLVARDLGPSLLFRAVTIKRAQRSRIPA